jgi:hypothetical protein
MEFVQKWDGRYRWPTRKDEAVVDKRFEMHEGVRETFRASSADRD